MNLEPDMPSAPPGTGASGNGQPSHPTSPAEEWDLNALVIEDDTPVDSVFIEKLERLLTEPLYSSWPGPGQGRPFQVFANVGLFYAYKEDPLVPDVMLSLDTEAGDLALRANRSYFMWLRKKPPEVVIEMVSDRRGREEDFKRATYARIGVLYYVIFDPEEKLGHGVFRCFTLHNGAYEPLPEAWFPRVGLGLTFWEGNFQGMTARWLRWCDQERRIIPTGQESAEQAKQHAQQEKERTKQEKQRTKQEKQRAEQEKQRATQAEEEASNERRKRERLEARLRALGLDPNDAE